MMAFALLGGCAKEEKTGSVHGVIVNKNTGEQVNAASVELGVWYAGRNTTLRRTVSGSDGQYEFKDIETDLSEFNEGAAGRAVHHIRVSKADFRDVYNEIKVEPGKVTTVDILLEPIK